MEVSTQDVYTVTITIPAVLYVISHLLAKFGKPKWAQKVSWIGQTLNGLGANWGKSKNWDD